MTVRTPAPPDSPKLSQEVQRRRKTIQNALLDWAQTASRRYPWRQRGRTPYQVLVAELLLKRTTSTAAARIYEDFLERFPSFESLAAASQDELEAVLATVGLQRQRAKAASEMAAYVLEQWDGDLPADIEQLLGIPHVGPYAAGAVCSFAFGQPAAIVDSNVERIISRLFGDSLPGKPSLALLRDSAVQMLPEDRHRDFNLGLLDLGALVCRYVRPRCPECPLLDSCDYGATALGQRDGERRKAD